MQFFERIRKWLSPNQPQAVTQAMTLNDLIQRARREQYSERYDDALASLAEAMAYADDHANTTMQVDITLSRADILIARGDYDTAEIVLNDLKDESEAKEHRAPLAYALASLGVIAQRRGEWEQARQHYERAKATAEAIQTLGAGGRATAHLADVYLHDHNASYAIHLLREAIPKLQASGDQELVGYFQGQLGKALIMSGQTETGLNVIQQGITNAETIQHQAQLRHLHMLLAEQYLDTGDSQQAQRHYNEALALYPDPPPSDITYVTALANMSKAMLRDNDAGLAQEYARKALTVAETLDNPDVIAQIEAIIGLTQAQSDDPQAAIPYLEQAIAAYDNLPVDAAYIDLLRHLAQAQQHIGATDAAQATYARAIDHAADFPLRVIDVYQDLAQLHIDAGNYRTALNTYNDALKLAEANAQHGLIGRLQCAIGALYARIGDGRMALRRYDDALLALNRIDDPRARGAILAQVAEAYVDYSDLDSAVGFFEEAIELAQETHDRHAEARRRGAYGRLLAYIKQPKQALTETMQARNIAEEHGMDVESAQQKNNIGIAYRVMGQADNALAHQREARGQLDEHPRMQAQVYADLGDTYAEFGLYDDAQTQYDTALTMAHAQQQVALIIQATIGQAWVAHHAGDDAHAQALLDDIEAQAKRANIRRYLAHWHELQSRLAAQRDDHAQARDAWEQAETLRRILQMPAIEPDWLA